MIKAMAGIKMETYDLTSEAKSLASRISREDQRNKDITIPEGSNFLRNMILKNLNHDLILTRGLGSIASMDPLHLPILHKKMTSGGGLHPVPGFVALEVAVPDLSEAPWDVVAEVRERKAMEEFRHRMIQIEKHIRDSLPDVGDLELRYQISQIINDELLNEVRSLRPKGKKVVADLTFDLLSSLVPPPYSTISAAASNIPEVVKLKRSQDSWITVFMKLRTPNRSP